MVGIFFLGAVLVVAFGLMALLFFSLKKESQDAGVESPSAVNLKSSFPQRKISPVFASSLATLPSSLEDLGSAPGGGMSPGQGQNALRERLAVDAHQAADQDRLREENKQCRLDIESLQADLARAKDSEELVQHLRAENAAFKIQLEVASLGSREQAAALEAAKEDLAGRLARAQEEVLRLESENASLRPAAEMALAEKKAGGADDSVALRKENEGLAARLAEIERVQAAKEEENKFLQYELTKSRAQAAGLERICDGSKKRLEDMAREARSAGAEKAVQMDQTEALQKSLDDFRRVSEGVSRAEIALPPEDRGQG